MKYCWKILIMALMPLAYAQAKDNLKIALDKLPSPNYSGIYVAMEKGFFAEQNINISLLPHGSIKSEKLVSKRKADIAFMSAEQLMITNEEGADITAIAAILAENPQFIAVQSGRNINSPKDFAGKTYACQGNGWYKILINQMMHNDGGQGEVKGLRLSTYETMAFLSKQVDLAWFFDNLEAPIFEEKGISLNKFYFKDYGLGNYGTPILIVNTNNLALNPKIFKRFLKATEKGYRWAAMHPEATVDILIAKSSMGSFPDKKLLLKQQKISSSIYIKNNIWGKIYAEEMDILAEFMISNGFAQNKESLKYSNQFFEFD